MSDIVERLRGGITEGTGIRWAVTKEHLEAADEITRLRSLLKEAWEALYLIVGPDACKASYEEECTNFEVARSVLSKIKGEA